MKIISKTIKKIENGEKCSFKIVSREFMKKILVATMITTNLSFCFTTASLAADNSNKEKKPAVVPGIAQKIISKYVEVSTSSSDNSESSGENKITNNSESGDGWKSTTTVTSSGATRTYRNYKQFNNGNSYWNNSYWDGNIASDGCGPTSMAIVLSGYGYNHNPGDFVKEMGKLGYNSSDSFSKLTETLKHIANIDTKEHLGGFSQSDLQVIRNNLNAGRPVVVNAPNHYIVLLGEDSDKLIISDPGDMAEQDYNNAKTLEDFINIASNNSSYLGYILITSDGGDSSTKTDSSSKSNKTTSTDNKDSTSQKDTNTASEPLRWPIGSDQTTTKNGKTFATGSPALGISNVSRGGVSRGWSSESHEKNEGQALDIGGGTQSGKYNVVAMGNGKVIQCGDGIADGDTSGNGGMGNYAIIDYGSGMQVRVMHMYNGTLNVKVGDTVETGQVIGKMGNSGDSTGTHTHVDMTINGKWVDIAKYIAEPGKTTSSNTSIEDSNSGTKSSVNMSGNITKNNHGGYKLDIDFDKEVEELIKEAKEKNFKINKYLSSKNQKEYLKNFLKAAIVTQYPDLRSAEEIAKDEEIKEGEVQGCIRIKRYADGETKSFSGNRLENNKDSDDDGTYLSYIPYEELNNLISKADATALNYFSMDSQNNLVVAGWETLDVDVSISQTGGETDPNPDSAPAARNSEYSKLTIKNMNYTSQVSNYSMPFSLLWSLLVYGNDEEFVNDVANLVINTKIIIGTYDETNTKITTYTNTYDKHNTTEDQVYLNHNNTGNTVTVDKVYTYTVTEVDTLKTDTPSMKIIYADTWTAVYNNNYKVKTEDEDDGDGDTTDLKDEQVSQDFKQVTEEDDINKRLNKNEKAKEYIEKEKERLKKETHEENEKNVKYRYNIINKKIDEEFNAAQCYKLLKEEDVQNYIINLIIDQNSDDYVKKVFKETGVIKEYAKELKISDMDAVAECVQRLVNEAKDKPETGDSLWDQLTKKNNDTQKNKTYSIDITSIQYQDTETRKNQKENIKTKKTKSKVEQVTSSNGNVELKTNKNSKTDNFVKLMYHSKKAKANLKIVDSWFFESMEETAEISDMVDLMKYLFQIVYNKSYGMSKEDIEELEKLFSPENMTKATNSGSSTHLTGGSVEVQVWNYFVDNGFSDAAAAGIMGNFWQETKLDPTCDAGASAGIACFEKSTGAFAEFQAYAASKGKTWTDLQCQLEYLTKQLPEAFNAYTGLQPHYYDTGEWCWWPEKMTLNDYKKLDDPEKAAEIFCRVYERPSLPMMSNRTGAAREYYNKYHK